MTSNTLAIAGPDAVGGGRAATIVRYLDLPALAIALPIFLAAGLPMLGYTVLAVTWLAGAALEDYGRRRSQRALAEGSRQGAMGWVARRRSAASGWSSLAILLVGLLGEREDGLAAAVLAAILFTVHFAAAASSPEHSTRPRRPGRDGPARRSCSAFGAYIA